MHSVVSLLFLLFWKELERSSFDSLNSTIVELYREMLLLFQNKNHSLCSCSFWLEIRFLYPLYVRIMSSSLRCLMHLCSRCRTEHSLSLIHNRENVTVDSISYFHRRGKKSTPFDPCSFRRRRNPCRDVCVFWFWEERSFIHFPFPPAVHGMTMPWVESQMASPFHFLHRRLFISF
jgi:hypothetical protein